MATDRTPRTTIHLTAAEALGSLLSRRAEGMIASLRAQADALVEDRACLFRGGTGRGSARELGIERRLRLKAHRKDDRREDKPDRDPYEVDVAEQMRRELREQQLGSLASEATEVLPWQRVLRQKRRIVLLGEPGGGKSYSTRLELARRLDRAATALEEAVTLPDEFPLLAWGTAEMLSDQPYASTSKAQRDAYLRASFRNVHVPTEIGSDRNSLIVIDALDEMSPSKSKAFTKNLKHLCQDFTGTVIVTCRVGQWMGRSDWIAADSFEVATFEPLQGREQLMLYRKIAGRFGANENHDTDSFQSLLLKRSFLSIDFGTPLLLTFAALLHLEGILATDETVTPSDLYGHILTRLLRGTWMENPPDRCTDEVAVENLRESLGLAAWKLFQLEESSERSGVRNLFSIAELKGSGIDEKSLRELQEVGLLVLAGKNRTGKLCFAFAHRSLLEFLAAEGLSAEQNRADLEKTVLTRSERLEDSIFWLLHEEWEPVLGFLHGLLPAALRDRLEKVENRDDFFDSVWKLRRRLGFSLTIEGVEYEGRTSDEAWHWVIQSIAVGLSDIRFIVEHIITGREQSLINLCRHKNANIRANSALCLGVVDSIESVETLISLCNDNNPDVRKCAAKSLGDIANKVSIQTLISLCNDPSYYVKKAAAEALGKIGSNESVDCLVSMMRDPNDEFGFLIDNVAIALEKIYRNSFLLHRFAIDSMSAPEAATYIINSYPLKRSLENALFGIVDFPVELLARYRVEDLITLCSHEEIEVRRLALLAIFWIHDERSRDALISLCSDEDDEIRAFAPYALIEIDNERALDYLTQEENISIPSAHAVGQIGNNRALEFLVSLSIDEDNDVRNMAAIGLGLIPNEKALATLISLSSDEDEGVRISAGRSLTGYDDSRAFDSVISLCGDESRMVRIFVARDLAEMADARWIDAFITLYRDNECAVRLWAVRGLRAIGGRRSLDFIISACYDIDKEVRQDAAAALGEIGGEEALRVLNSISCRLRLNGTLRPRKPLSSLLQLCIQKSCFWIEKLLKNGPIKIRYSLLRHYIVENGREILVSEIASGLAKSGEEHAFFVLESYLRSESAYSAAFPWKEHRLIQKRCRRAFLPYEWKLKE